MKQEFNYDDVLCEEGVVITISGNKYEINPPTLEQIFKYEKLYQEMNKLTKLTDILQKMKVIIKSIYEIVPDDVLDQVSPQQLRNMLSDVRGIIQRAIFPGISEEDIKNVDKKK